MKLLSKVPFFKLDFRQQLALAVSAGIVGLTIVSSLVISATSSQTLYDQLLQQGQNITGTFSKQSAQALLRRHHDWAKDAAMITLAIPNIDRVAIFTPDHTPFYQAGAAALKQESAIPWPSKEPMYTEDSEAWYFRAPVYMSAQTNIDSSPETATSSEQPSGELLGFVQVVITKDILSSTTQQIFRNNLAISSGVGLLLLFFLLAFISRATKPLKHLATTMATAQRGQNQTRAELCGPKDIVDMESAFNTVMDELETQEQELKRARDTALASAKIKGEFAATVSHELRTPMNGVMGMLELLHGMGLSEKQEEYVKIARSSSEALLVLIDEILDFSKIESGKLKIQSININPREILDDISDLLSVQARQKKLHIKVDIANAVPNAVRGDSARIRQVLAGLVNNAIKFTENGDIALRLSVTKNDTQQEQLYFEIEDTGIGIPLDSQRRIFEAFAQVDSSTTRKYGGSGLGLAICQQLVVLMGGRLGVDSTVDVGSTFWFTIPLEVSQHDNVDAAKLAGLRVLITSADVESCRALMQTFIDWESFQRNVADGNDAFYMLKASSSQGKPYDIIVIDTPIEGQSAIELVRKIRLEPMLKNTQIIVLSNSDPFVDNADKTLGTWLPKSPSVAKLFDTINHLLLRRAKDISPAKPTAKHTQPVRPAHILVAEDNGANQKVALGMLDRFGYQAEVANNGEEVLTLIAQRQFDLILMDCIMPVMDGYEAARRIRENEAKENRIPIIAMTANVGPNDSQGCLNAGMDDFIAKPINLEELEQKLISWLASNTAVTTTTTQTTAQTTAQTTTQITATAYEPDKNQYDVVDSDKALDTQILPTLDEQALAKLRLETGSTFPAMIEAFLDSTPKLVDELNEFVHAEDTQQICNTARCIRGSSLSLGAKKLVHYCDQLTDVATNSIEDAPIIIDHINREYCLLQGLFKQYQTVQNSDVPSIVAPENQPRILVVDDDVSARIALKGVLEQDGYAIFEAENGSSAIDLCNKELPDLVLMDAMMPGTDGFQTCERIQQLDIPSIPPVLMITALQDEKSIEKAFTSGATDFTPKPVNLTVLRQRISRLLKTNRVAKQAHQPSHYDSLTSLPNRTLFMQRAKEFLQHAEKNKQKIAIMFLDLDRFKLINDTQGHDAGDLLLKTMALRLQGCVRNADLVARIDGDEFTVVLDDIHTPDVAARIAEKIGQTLLQPFAFMQQQVYVSASIGIAIYPKNGSNIGTLIKHANTAMFRAKSKGGGCFQFYEYGMETEISRLVELENELRVALERDELILHYQPQANLLSNVLVGMEALVRWQHPQRGLLPPAEFIPLAEETEMINALGDWVLLQVCRQQKAWLNQGNTPLPVSVNISGYQLEDDLLFKKIRDILNETKLPPHLLKLEITEDTLADHGDSIIDQLHRLKELGVSLAIDDFGTGYSSLGYLKRFPVDTLKIDHSFIGDLPDNEDSAALTSGIIALGHSLGMSIVAEGVETRGQRAFLKEQGCDIEQGYLLSRPLSKLDIEKWLSARVSQQKKMGR